MANKVKNENKDAALKEFLLKVYKYQMNTGQLIRANATMIQIKSLEKVKA